SNDQFTVELLDKESSVWEDVGTVKTDLGKTAEQIAEEIENMVSGQVDPGDETEKTMLTTVNEGSPKIPDGWGIVSDGVAKAGDMHFMPGTLNPKWTEIKSEHVGADVENFFKIIRKLEVLDPVSSEGYAKIMADESLQLQYQDVLDSFFQERIVAVRNALRYVDWDGENGATSLSKTLGGVVYQASFSYKQVGAGANIVGFTVSVNSNSREGGIAQIATIVDDLSRTPEQIAGEIDGAVSVDDGNSGNESEEITAAKNFLQSVIDGGKDAANLMDLLDEIDASAKALIDAGMGSEYDDLIGKAAEKWAELDQQANG
ncbi:hypothetical protein, partial [Nitrosomonas marina]